MNAALSVVIDHSSFKTARGATRLALGPGPRASQNPGGKLAVSGIVVSFVSP